MGHVRDRHTEIGPGGRRIHNARWGKGKRWQARWIEDGRERSGSFETKDAALLHLARVESGVAPVIAEGTLFSTYAESWLSHRLDLRTNSRSQIRSRLDTRILPSFGDRPLAGITKADVRAAVASWAGAPRRPRPSADPRRFEGQADPRSHGAPPPLDGHRRSRHRAPAR